MRFLATLSLTTLLAALPAQTRTYRAEDGAARSSVANQLREVLRDRYELPATVALAAIAGQGLPAGSRARAELDRALAAANVATEAKSAAATLRQDLGELVATLEFKPRQEAELPAGFPAFAAVDEFEVRHYPAYRMVRTVMRSGSSGAFWPLFRHIESNGIAMTSPVQMDWQPADADRTKPVNMAFLYGSPTTSPATTDAGVEVVDAPAATEVSLGAIGDDRRSRVEEMQVLLQQWLAAHPEWVAAGPLRSMGYNSPMVPRDRRYFEVQLPIRRSLAASH
jgi:hypothetical protein